VAPAVASWPTPATGSAAHTPAPGWSRAPFAAIIAAGAAGRLLPFELPLGLNAVTLRSLGPNSAALAIQTRAGTARHAAEPSPLAQGGGMAPDAPSGPPGNAAVAGNAGGFGGTSSGQWCAILAGLLAFSCQRLRRHRVRSVLPGPIGVAFLLQRPG
jgi:hypothetical protein